MDFMLESDLSICLLQSTSSLTNIYARLTHDRFKQTIVSAKNGGSLEARKRVLAQLPISAQSFSRSATLLHHQMSFATTKLVLYNDQACPVY